MLNKRFFSILLSLILALVIAVPSKSLAMDGFSKNPEGQLVLNFDRNNTYSEGSFLGHSGEGRIFIKNKQRGTMFININGNSINLSREIHKLSNEWIEVDVGGYVNEGENKIAVRTNGKDSTSVVIPYLKLKDGKPEEVGMSSEELSKIDDLVKGKIDSGVTPGAVILIAKNGVIVKNTAYGLAQKYDMGRILENPRVMTEDTIFDMASVTKVMATTQSIMKLISEGRLNLNDRVIKYIPQFGANGKENITIADLLTHTSGLTPWKPTYYHVKNSEEELKFICNLPLEYPTGTQRKYSDFSFMTLGFVVESITGQRQNEYAEKNIYERLRMKDTMFVPSNNLKNRIAATSWGNPYEYLMIATDNPYPCDEEVDDFKGWRNYTLVGEVNDGNSYYGNGGIAGHAGLFSTAKDLAVLGQTMLNGGGYDTEKIYDKSVVDEFTKPQRFTHGYGFEINRSSYMGGGCSPAAFGHTGFTGTQVVFDPSRNLQIIVLTNKQNNGLNQNNSYFSTFSLSKGICDIAYNSIMK